MPRWRITPARGAFPCIISIGTPSRPSALFTRQTGKVETQPTPSCLRMRLMTVATSIVMEPWFAPATVVRSEFLAECRDKETCHAGHNSFSKELMTSKGIYIRA